MKFIIRLEDWKFNTNIKRYEKINGKVIFYHILIIFNFTTN